MRTAKTDQTVMALSLHCNLHGSFKQLNLVIPTADLRRAVVSFWQNYVHIVLVNPLGGQTLPRNSVSRLTGHTHG